MWNQRPPDESILEHRLHKPGKCCPRLNLPRVDLKGHPASGRESRAFNCCIALYRYSVGVERMSRPVVTCPPQSHVAQSHRAVWAVGVNLHDQELWFYRSMIQDRRVCRYSRVRARRLLATFAILFPLARSARYQAVHAACRSPFVLRGHHSASSASGSRLSDNAAAGRLCRRRQPLQAAHMLHRILPSAARSPELACSCSKLRPADNHIRRWCKQLPSCRSA